MDKIYLLKAKAERRLTIAETVVRKRDSTYESSSLLLLVLFALPYEGLIGL